VRQNKKATKNNPSAIPASINKTTRSRFVKDV